MAKFGCPSILSLAGSASRTDLSQLANGIWEIHAGCPSFLRVSSIAKIGYIPQFKASNARDQDEVSSDLARMVHPKSSSIVLRISILIFTFHIISQVSDFQLHISSLIFMLFDIKSDLT